MDIAASGGQNDGSHHGKRTRRHVRRLYRKTEDRARTRAEGRTAVAALVRSAPLIRGEQTPFAMRQLTMANRRFGSKADNIKVSKSFPVFPQ
jgi:hypothetical protein